MLIGSFGMSGEQGVAIGKLVKRDVWRARSYGMKVGQKAESRYAIIARDKGDW